MRVISGKYKGKVINGFDILGTRPTMDRVKESMFASIQGYLKNSVCVDLFAGSGSLGIEALSNGASCCYFVENSDSIFNILKGNLSSVDGSILLKKDYMDALKYFIDSGIKFDLIFLDPPYKLNLINGVLDFVTQNNLLNPHAIVVCEYEGENVSNSNLKLIKSKKYGSKKVDFYKNS